MKLKSNESASALYVELSQGDKRYLQYIADGHSARSIAKDFSISDAELERTIVSLKMKFDVASTADLVRIALEANANLRR